MYNRLTLNHKAKKIDNIFCRELRLVAGTLSENKTVAWGIDPGVNFGLTVIENEKVYVYNGSLIQMAEPGQYGLVAYHFLSKIIKEFGHAYRARLIIEGAAYGAPYRQVELAEIRMGFYLAGALVLPVVKVVPPTRARRVVFDDGKQQAMDIWPLLNHNAADSLALAMYGVIADI